MTTCRFSSGCWDLIEAFDGYRMCRPENAERHRDKLLAAMAEAAELLAGYDHGSSEARRLAATVEVVRGALAHS